MNSNKAYPSIKVVKKEKLFKGNKINENTQEEINKKSFEKFCNQLTHIHPSTFSQRLRHFSIIMYFVC